MKKLPWIWLVPLADLTFIGLFVLAGQKQHGVLITGSGWLQAAAPFWVAWLLVGLLAGAFRPESLSSPVAALKKVLLAWLPAALVGLWLRSLLVGGPIQIPFAAVVIFTNLAVLMAWRTFLSTRVLRRQS